MIAELRGGICILGAPFFKSRERLDAAAGFSVRHFFKFTGSLVTAELKGRHFFYRVSFFSELHSLQLFFRYHTKKTTTEGRR